MENYRDGNKTNSITNLDEIKKNKKIINHEKEASKR